ncbi:MAG: DNA recombination protein RmuC [Rikenellaceae bacterium]|nr:DNA recombination protein RmuC [Rikenellaceae bacterium]
MDLVYIIIIVLLVATLVGLLVYLRSFKQSVSVLEQRAEEAEQQVRQAESAREQERVLRVKAETQLEAERQSVADKVRSQEDMEKALREQFRNLAGDVLQEQSRRFKENNTESMNMILKPLKDNIADFRLRMEGIFSHQTEQSGALKNELKRLMELNAQITTETTNLTNALKGNSKVQGDWGEVILQTILEKSNLIKGVHYDTQLNVKDEEGNNLRPDVVMYLPGDKQIIIDSKVSLTAYVNYVAAESDAAARAAMAAHVASVRQHVKELGSKQYQQYMQSPDFVIMFVPNEPAFLDALKEDNTIWSDAYEKKVIVSSPTNLFALLKIVADLWQRDEQTKNQEKIIKCGTTLYEQLVAFEDELLNVGASIVKAQENYDKALKRLRSGNNNIVRVGERLRDMGLPTAKRQNSKLLNDISTSEEA